MDRSRRLASAVLLVLLVQLTACQPEPAPGPDNTPPDQPTGDSPDQPTGGSPGQPIGNPPVQTSPYSLTAAFWDPDPSPPPSPWTNLMLGVLTTDSMLAGPDFRYDAFVVTAHTTGTVIIKSEVTGSSSKTYPYGYGYPLSMTTIEDGVSLTAYGGSYIQDALNTGIAVIDYPVQAGRQYILVYKTFGAFTPLTYRLWLPEELTVEGRIYTPPEPVPVPTISAGLITLENPRPDALSHFVPWLNTKVPGN